MKIDRALLCGIIVWGLAIAVGETAERGAAAPGTGGPKGEIADPVFELRQEISSLNLINALNLTPEQVRQILDLANRREAMQKQFAAQVETAAREAKPVLGELRGILEKQEPIPDELEQRVFRLDNKNRRMFSQMGADLAGSGQQIDSILTESQLAVVKDFEPCTIPPRNLSDPVRAGQASNSAIGEEMLRRIRGMSDGEFRMEAQRIADFGIARASEHHGKLSAQERSEERERILALMKKVRGMSDVEFEMEKDKLGQELKPKQKIKELQQQMEKAKTGVATSKAARILLSPAAVSVLRKRAKQMNVVLTN